MFSLQQSTMSIGSFAYYVVLLVLLFPEDNCERLSGADKASYEELVSFMF